MQISPKLTAIIKDILLRFIYIIFYRKGLGKRPRGACLKSYCEAFNPVLTRTGLPPEDGDGMADRDGVPHVLLSGQPTLARLGVRLEAGSHRQFPRDRFGQPARCPQRFGPAHAGNWACVGPPPPAASDPAGRPPGLRGHPGRHLRFFGAETFTTRGDA